MAKPQPFIQSQPSDFTSLTEEDYKTIDEDAERCLTDLWFLVTEVLYRHDRHKYGPFHKWMCDTVGKTPGTRELWLLPRDHFKTTILTIGHAIQQMLADPTIAVLLISRKDDHALLWSEEIRRQFVFNPLLRTYFPEYFAEVVSMEQLGSREEWVFPGYKVVKGVRRREPSVTATGIKARKQSKHYNWIYADDCMDIEDTTEVGLREIIQDWKDLVPLSDRQTGIIIPGTRKHYNDLYQHIMDNDRYKVYVCHGLQSKTDPCKLDECSRYAQPHKAPDLNNGEPLCPERMDRKDYEAKLKECEIDPKHGVAFFYHEYMNIPFSPADRKFQPRWFVQVSDEQIPGGAPPFHPLTKMIAIDTAWKDDEHPSGYDFTCIVVGGFDRSNGFLYILDIFRKRDWTVKAGCEAIFTLMRSHEYGGISTILSEKVSDNISWHEFLRSICRGFPLQIIPLTRGGGGSQGRRNKFERIEQSCQGPFETGRVFFRKKSDNFDDAVNEFCNLRRWTNDDIADSISMFFDARVQVLPPAPLRVSDFDSRVRPMPYEGRERIGAFRQHAADPLGRGGALGPATMSNPRAGYSIRSDDPFNWTVPGGGI